MADDGESLESWLNKATSPSNRQEDWEYILGFCDQINKELEGPQISVRLLAHKIQSPQEWEALQALTVLEACMKNCGRRFHNEVGKFKFLNELIKVVSPKYLGDKVSEEVKKRVIEMLYTWTVSLPDEAKICEAYQMLKSQGIVLFDPDLSLDATLIPPPSPRPKNPVFDDENKSKRLSELLKSKKPEDLQEANRLIKNMVKEDEVRVQKAAKQQNTLEAVSNSVKLLNEMLAHFSPDDSSGEEKELIKELYSNCDKLRQTVFQLATETEDDDGNLGDILQASDDLSHVINSYKKIVEGQTISGFSEETQASGQLPTGNVGSSQSEILIDLASMDTPHKPREQSSVPFLDDLIGGSDVDLQHASAPSATLSLLDEELLSLSHNEPCLNESAHVKQKVSASLQNLAAELDLFDQHLPSLQLGTTSLAFDDLCALSAISGQNSAATSYFPGSRLSKPTLSSGLDSTHLASFSQPLSSALNTMKPPAPLFTVPPAVPPPHSLTMSLPGPCFSMTSGPPSLSSQQACVSSAAPPMSSSSLCQNLLDLTTLDLGMDNPSDALTSAELQRCSVTSAIKHYADETLLSATPLISQASPVHTQELSLAKVFVPLEAVKTSKVCPVTAYDKNGVRVLLHFASDCPPGRPDVLVMVASMLNTAPQPVRSVVLQAAVPKTMKIKLQPPSGTELAPFNPLLAPAAITQVILLANPLKEKVRIRYKLVFTLGEQPFAEVGEVNEFPPTDSWGAL